MVLFAWHSTSILPIFSSGMSGNSKRSRFRSPRLLYSVSYILFQRSFEMLLLLSLIIDLMILKLSQAGRGRLGKNLHVHIELCIGDTQLLDVQKFEMSRK